MVFSSAGQCNWQAMKTLNGMLKGRAIRLFQHVWSDLNDVVGPDSYEEAIERSVVELAQ